jgi:uncharacterized protein (TIGR00255 family)
MIKSMTGFGAAKASNDTLAVTVEIRTLNSKSLDASFRLPRQYSDKEVELRSLLTQTLERGKINLSIEVQSLGELKPKVAVNQTMVKAYYQQLQQVAIELGADQGDLLRLALQLPEAYLTESSSDETSAQEWVFIRGVIEEALRTCDDFRTKEGQELAVNLNAYITRIGKMLKEIESHDPERIQKIRERISSHLQEVVTNENFDRNRFEQEMIYYIEKLDISEEKVRLRLHLDHFMEVLQGQEAPGKKLNFISQEIGREINTIGSKANDAIIQRFVIDMKEELEKIKEQSLNIL